MIFHVRIAKITVDQHQQRVAHHFFFALKMIHDECEQITQQAYQVAFTLVTTADITAAAILTRRKIMTNLTQSCHAVQEHLMLKVNQMKTRIQFGRQRGEHRMLGSMRRVRSRQ
jgi:hypothetical protein